MKFNLTLTFQRFHLIYIPNTISIYWFSLWNDFAVSIYR